MSADSIIRAARATSVALGSKGTAYNSAAMRRSAVERSLRDVHGRLVRKRQELAVLDEQLGVLTEAADDARLRALVSETPIAGHDFHDAQRHADAAARAREELVGVIDELEHRQDELLGKLAGE